MLRVFRRRRTCSTPPLWTASTSPSARRSRKPTSAPSSAVRPYTIFAPTDAAFDKLPASQLENLFKPENKDELVSLVNFHVIKGSKMAADIGKWETAKMINGQSQPVKLADGKISIGGAHVIAADITTSNGVMHGIDKVNVPASTKH